MTLTKSFFAIGLCSLIAACASTPEPGPIDNARDVTADPNDNAPEWVFLPKSDKGLASSACVNWTGNMGIDRPHAIASARADMAQQLSVKASVLDKLYNRKLQADNKNDTGASFEQVSKQLTDETLESSTPEEIALASLDGKKYLCALVVLNDSEEAFNDLVDDSGRELDPRSKAALYEEFRAQKAMKELESELDAM